MQLNIVHPANISKEQQENIILLKNIKRDRKITYRIIIELNIFTQSIYF